MRKWRAANPEKVKAQWARRNEQRVELWTADPEAFRAAARERFRNLPPESRAKYRDWEQARRARKQAAFVEDVPFDEILQRDEGYCGICGEPVMETTIELDHIVPLAAGGLHERANVQLAHRFCNRSKHAKLVA